MHLLGHEPKRLDLAEEFDTYKSVLHSADPNALYHIDDDRDDSVPAEIEDEQIRVALASQLFFQESDAEDDLRRIYHSNEESLFKGSPPVSDRTRKPVKSQALKHKSSQEVETDRMKAFLETQQDQLLSEAKSEILNYS